jgi:hypothetical protein
MLKPRRLPWNNEALVLSHNITISRSPRATSPLPGLSLERAFAKLRLQQGVTLEASQV